MTVSRAETGADIDPDGWIGAGIDARREGVLDADAVIGPDLEWTGPRVHRELFDPHADIGPLLTRAIVDVLDTHELEQEQKGLLATLEDLGVTALNGQFAELCVEAESGMDDDAPWELWRTARQLGSGQTSLDLRSRRGDIDRAAIPIFAASDVTPTIAIHLDGHFTDRKAEQRRDVLDLCLSLAKGCRVHLVVSGLVGTVLWKHHRDQLPTSVTEPFDPRVSASPGTPRSVADRATTARRALDPDGTATNVLRALRKEPAEMLSYDALSEGLGLSKRNRRQVALKLDREFKLAERIDMPGGDRGLSLRPAGQTYLDAINTEIGRQQRLSAVESDTVTQPPNPSEYSRVIPHVREGSEEDGPPGQPLGRQEEEAGNECDRSAEGGETIAGTQERPHGDVQPVYLDRPSFEGARSAAEPDEIALVDASTEELTRRDGTDDFRAMGWSYEKETGDLVVAAKYTNPMQFWTCIARALASWWTWERVLNEETLTRIFADHSPRILRDARNIGGLSEERYENPEAFIEYYREQEQTLCDLTQKWNHGDYDDAAEMRSEITTLAKGLSGSIAQLLDLADVTLVREVRLPEFSRNWSDDQRRKDLVRTLAHGCSIESLYGHFVVHRQLYEDRKGHRAAAMDPAVDARDPLAQLVGSIVVVGPSVSDLEVELRSALRSPAELHEDAPELAVRLPVRTSTSASRSMIARTVRQMCDRKQLEATRKAVSLFDGFLATSYDVARAMHWGLEAEESCREIRVNEVRRALAHLAPDRLLATTDMNPSMQKALSVLLGARKPLSGAELCRRAGISTQSFRDNRTGFVIADLLRETPEGWRVALSFADERYGERDILPWFVVEKPSGHPHFASIELRRWSDVVFELAEEVCVDTARFGDPEDVLCWAFMPPDTDESDPRALVEYRRAARQAFCEEWPWLRVVLPVIDAACGTPVVETRPPASQELGAVLMGPRLSQQSLATDKPAH